MRACLSPCACIFARLMRVSASLRAWECVRMCERMCLCVSARVHECTCACICACMCACACMFMSAFVGVCANQMCMRAGVRIYAHVRVPASAKIHSDFVCVDLRNKIFFKVG